MPIAWPAAHATCPSDAWVSARYRYRWWKAAFRLGTGFVAASLLLVEQLVRSLRAPFWLKIRTVNVLLCCVWAVVFAPVGGLADLMASAPILASCDGGGDFVMQEIRMHPAVLLLLFAGPVLELPYVHVGIAATMTGATELALALAAHLHGNLFVVFDHVGVTLMRTLASGRGLLLRSALTCEAVSAGVCALTVILASTMTAYSTEQSARSLFLQNFSLTKENLHLNQVLSMRGLKDDKARRTKIVSNSEKMVEVINRYVHVYLSAAAACLFALPTLPGVWGSVSLRDRFGEDDDDLSEALELIQLSGGLFAPDLTELELSQDVEAPIKEWLLTGPARLGDQKCVARPLSWNPACMCVCSLIRGVLCQSPRATQGCLGRGAAPDIAQWQVAAGRAPQCCRAVPSVG